MGDMKSVMGCHVLDVVMLTLGIIKLSLSWILFGLFSSVYNGNISRVHWVVVVVGVQSTRRRRREGLFLLLNLTGHFLR